MSAVLKELRKRILSEEAAILIGRHVNTAGDFKLVGDQSAKELYIKLSDGSAWTTYLTIDANGIETTGLTATTITAGDLTMSSAKWDDLRFPATGLNPPGAVSDPDVDTTDGTLLFDKASTETIVGIAQVPHAWKVGTNLRPHIHWTPTDDTAGDVVWKLEYKVAPIGDDVPAAYTAATTTATIAADSDTLHILTEFDDIDMSEVTGLSCIILWKLSRIGGSTDPADDYDNDAKLLELDFHYQIDSVGSDTEYVK